LIFFKQLIVPGDAIKVYTTGKRAAILIGSITPFVDVKPA
jgi:hypothetical protein